MQQRYHNIIQKCLRCSKRTIRSTIEALSQPTYRHSRIEHYIKVTQRVSQPKPLLCTLFSFCFLLCFFCCVRKKKKILDLHIISFFCYLLITQCNSFNNKSDSIKQARNEIFANYIHVKNILLNIREVISVVLRVFFSLSLAQIKTVLAYKVGRRIQSKVESDLFIFLVIF